MISCPTNLLLQSIDGNAQPAIYNPPTVVGGAPPVKTSCNPASGSNFVFGTSTVTCTATDAMARASSCSFTVTLTTPPRLSVSKFMAFGNSITEGKNASSVILANNYPSVLRGLLQGRYSTQTITMVNRGFGGEWAADGKTRLPSELDANHPDALLLEEGVNDLNGGNPASIAPMIDALRVMVREGKSRGLPVFLGTLPPEREGGSRASAFPSLPAANSQIRMLALSENVTLVDLYEGMGASPDPFIDTDGLHPNEAGYQRIAQLFFDAIRTQLELQAGVTSATELVRNMPLYDPPFARAR